jgi:hypothetical protein
VVKNGEGVRKKRGESRVLYKTMFTGGLLGGGILAIQAD